MRIDWEWERKKDTEREVKPRERERERNRGGDLPVASSARLSRITKPLSQPPPLTNFFHIKTTKLEKCKADSIRISQALGTCKLHLVACKQHFVTLKQHSMTWKQNFMTCK